MKTKLRSFNFTIANTRFLFEEQKIWKNEKKFQQKGIHKYQKPNKSKKELERENVMTTNTFCDYKL